MYKSEAEDELGRNNSGSQRCTECGMTENWENNRVSQKGVMSWLCVDEGSVNSFYKVSVNMLGFVGTWFGLELFNSTVKTRCKIMSGLCSSELLFMDTETWISHNFHVTKYSNFFLNIETFLTSQAVQKQAIDWSWPSGSTCPLLL